MEKTWRKHGKCHGETFYTDKNKGAITGSFVRLEPFGGP